MGRLSGRIQGTAGAPKEGTQFGSLNSIEEANVQPRIDYDANNFFTATRAAALERYVPDALSNRGTYRGIVLKVLPPPPEPEGWLRRFFTPLGIRPPVLVKIICRIPELDAALPEPSIYGDTAGPWQEIIQMHTTYTAQDETLPVPAVGSIVELDFEDKQNLEGPKYVSNVGDQTPAAGAAGSPGGDGTSTAAAAAAYAAARGNCGSLAAMGPGGAPLGTGAGSYPVGQLPGGRSGAGPWYNPSEGMEGVIAFTVHSTAGGHYGSPERALRSWIGHGTRSENRVSTNFVIIEDGTIVLLCPPERYRTWHGGYMNRIAVGVDLCGHPDPDESNGPHTEAQFEALARLVECREFWNLAIIGHSHHKRNRSDPGHFIRADNPGTSVDQLPWDQEPFASRTLPIIAAAGIRNNGTWIHTDDDTYESAKDAEHDLRGTVGPSKALGARGLEEIYNRLSSQGSAGSRPSYMDIVVNKAAEYVSSVSNTTVEWGTAQAVPAPTTTQPGDLSGDEPLWPCAGTEDGCRVSIVSVRIRGTKTVMVGRGCGINSALREGTIGLLDGEADHPVTLSRITGQDTCEMEIEGSIGAASHIIFP